MGGETVPLPAYWLLAHVPPFTEVFYPMRALPLVLLAMGAMITLLLVSWRAAPRGRWAVPLACAILLLDLLGAYRGDPRLPAHPFSLPPSHRQIAGEAGSFGVLDLPPPVNDGELGRYYLYQLEHRKQIPYNLDMNALPHNRTPAIQGYFSGLKLEHAPPNHPANWGLASRQFKCPSGCLAWPQMVRLGYRYVVLNHTGHAALDRELTACVERCLPGPVKRDRRTSLYRIPAPERRKSKTSR